MHQQQEHHSYIVPPIKVHESWLWSLSSQIASCFLLAVVMLTLYIIGWNLTFDYFWRLGWYYFAFVPWTITFLVLIAIGVILFARYRIGSIAYTVPQEQPTNEVPFYMPPGENHPDEQPRGVYSDGLRALP